MKDNADVLSVQYLIWQGQIWPLAREADDWRPYNGGGMHDPASITGGHDDHLAVLMLIVWAIATAYGNYATASKGRTGVLAALGAAVLAGGGVAWMNWLLNLGQQLSVQTPRRAAAAVASTRSESREGHIDLLVDLCFSLFRDVQDRRPWWS